MYRQTFKQLSKDDLYAILKLRQDVFIVEQNSIYADLDELDQSAIHYLLKNTKQKLFGYARYRQAPDKQIIKIERVVLDKKSRGGGHGKDLINTMLTDIQDEYPHWPIMLSSQVDASEFYRRLGFVAFGKPYDDGGIEHISMAYEAHDK
ncbi:GNAT family N-acetyltransferase [Paraglaciecola aquimarina]|uniref:GNAT family N-acetyltransferase n=1 Tax=Paraglaciecola aquimarina TaxID=1235557 RepID=A0ABU3SZV6_9ALTE|nr:GNAT family N-acetyltransferase [Paraglaciecola aquimarina]MDU0355523.1 GNAT family N-acetyltransferase [Paraglaciecola aquimarina]